MRTIRYKQEKPNWKNLKRAKKEREAAEAAMKARPDPSSDPEDSAATSHGPSGASARPSGSDHDGDGTISKNGPRDADAARPPPSTARPARPRPPRAFAPELDNVLLRSLLYEDTYLAPPIFKRPRTDQGCQTGGREREGGEGGEGANANGKTSGGGGSGGGGSASSAVRTGGTASNKGEGASSYPPFSPRAGKRPAELGDPHGPRLGPAFGLSLGKGQGRGKGKGKGPAVARILDGTAAAFGARARGSFRDGLAASMITLGLVPRDTAAATTVAARFDVAIPGSSSGNDPAGASRKSQSTSPRQLDVDAGNGFMNAQNGVASWDDARMATGRDERSGRSDASTADEERSGGGDDVLPANVRRGSSWKGKGRAASTNGGSGSGRSSMVLDEDKGEEEREVEKEDEVREVVNPNRIRRGSPANWNDAGGGSGRGAGGGGTGPAIAAPAPAPNHRMWNLRHMHVISDSGSRAEVCCSCRSHPSKAAMVCTNPDLAKLHFFCFPCLEKKEGIAQADLKSGKIQVGIVCVSCTPVPPRENAVVTIACSSYVG